MHACCHVFGVCVIHECIYKIIKSSYWKYCSAVLYDSTSAFSVLCVSQELTKRSLITATAASSLIGCFLMGIGGNLPIALAPGMGLNAYFTYNVVGYRGTGSVSCCLPAIWCLCLCGCKTQGQVCRRAPVNLALQNHQRHQI